MKTITVNVSEPVYAEFQNHASKVRRKTSELIREAMEEYRNAHLVRKTSLRNRKPPADVGGVIAPITADDDILEEMLDATRD